MFNDKKKKGEKQIELKPLISEIPEKAQVEIPQDIIGKRVRHKIFGEGKISRIEGPALVVNFDKLGEKRLAYEICIEEKLLKFI